MNEAIEILKLRGTPEGVKRAFRFYNDNKLGIKRTNMHCGRCVMAVWKAIENYSKN